MSQTMTASPGSVEATARLVKDLHNPQILDLPDGNEVLVVPQGMRVEALKPLMDPYRTRPERRKGTAQLRSIDSLIEWVNRFKDDDSALFASNDMERPGLMAVIDYHRRGAEDVALPRFGQHRAVYNFPVSKAWTTWLGQNDEWQPMVAFAHFLEDNIMDVVPPPADGTGEANAKTLAQIAESGGKCATPARLQELARTFEVNEAAAVKNAHAIASGETQIVFETTHSQAGGPVNVPSCFLLQIPVFEMDAAYRIVCRFRYRLSGGKVLFSYSMRRPDLYFEDAFNGACARVKSETSLPLILGAPEA